MAGTIGLRSLHGAYIDAYLVRTDMDGNEIWNRTYGGPGSDYLSTVIAADDGYVLAGETNDSTWLIKTDMDGNEIWNRTYGTGSGDEVVSTSDGYVLVVNSGTEDNLADFHLMKTDSGGNMVWDRKLGKYLTCSLVSVPDGYILAGGTDMSGNTTYQVYLMKTDSNGDLAWNVTYAMAGENFGKTLIVDRGAYVIVGDSSSKGNATQNFPAALLVKTDRDNSQATPATSAASLVLTTLAVIVGAIVVGSRK